MAGPENLRRGILPITASSRERTANSLPPKPEATPVSPQPKKGKERKRLSKKARIALAGLAVAGVGVGAYEAYENVPAIRESIGSFLNSFNNKEGPVLVETKKVNPEEIFDPYAKRQVITLKNFVFMSPEEYKDIVPPVIDPKHPERVNIFFPIRFAEGSGERRIVIEKRTQRLSVTGGKRIISENNTSSNDEPFLVLNTYKITEGLMPEDQLISTAGGMIERASIKPVDKDGILRPGGFIIKGTDQYGNEFQINFGGISALRTEKDVPSATTIQEEVRVGNIVTTGYRIEPHPVPVKEGEVLGTVVEAKIDPVKNQTDGQFEIWVLSKVTGEDGKTQGGPAEIMFNITPNGQLISPKAK